MDLGMKIFLTLFLMSVFAYVVIVAWEKYQKHRNEYERKAARALIWCMEGPEALKQFDR